MEERRGVGLDGPARQAEALLHPHRHDCPQECDCLARSDGTAQPATFVLNRQNGSHDGAKLVALVGVRTTGLRRIHLDDATVALRLLVDQRDELGHARAQTVNRLHRLLLELLPEGAKKFLSAAQARVQLASVLPATSLARPVGGWPPS